MLGLGNSLSASSASFHEQMYSLTLDGTGDYLATSSAFQSTHRGSFSYSFWMKPDDGQPGAAENLLGSDNNADEDAFFITLDTAGKIKIDHEANNDPASYITDAAVYADGAGDWKHVCVTVTKDTNTSYIIYIDGVAVAGSLTNAVAEAAHAAWTSADAIYIGATNDDGTALNPFTGKMDEVALWNVALDADAVAAVYNSGKPFDLTVDRGNYDNASDLQGYWRMFNGTFDNKVYGVIHDQNDPGFGTELYTGVSGDDANWVVSGTNTKAEDDGAVKITYVDQSTGNKLLFTSSTGEFSTNLTVGAVYKLEFDAKINSGYAHMKYYAAASSPTQTMSRTINNTEFERFTIYHACGSVANDRIETSSFGSGEILWIKNISLKKLNGYPGIVAADATFSTDTPDD